MKMPLPNNNIFYDLLDKNDANQIVCRNGNCNGEILHSHVDNLETHFKIAHPELYSTCIQQKRELRNINNKLGAKLNPKELNQANIELAIVELFTKNGQPLDMIEDRAFKMLVQPVFDALNIRVNEYNINERIIAFSQKMKSEIVNDLKGKLLSLKIDAATSQDISILGINVQYIQNKCIQIKTLAVKELKSGHTSEHLRSIILAVLKDYAVDLSQILTITTDNGANMFVNTMRDLNTDLRISLEDESVDNTEEESVDSSLIDDKMEAIRLNFSSHSIIDVQCGAYTLQLCVYDVLEDPEIKEKLEECRSVIKNLRDPAYLNILKVYHFRKPVLDRHTKWDTSFTMLERLLEIKNVIDLLSNENTNLFLGPEVWDFVKEFIKIFKPVYTASIKLQSEQLYFSQLYVIIMDILIQIKNLPSTEMRTLLENALNRRKEQLFDNELFNAAVFLDPRMKICMTAEQKRRAKIDITSLYKRINQLKETTSEISNKSLADEHLEEPSTSSKSLPKSFSEYLRNLDPVISEPISSLSLSQLEADLLVYERQSRLPLHSNIINFWSMQNNTLSVIAETILAIPSTQVSVAPLLSALKYISSDQRNGLTPFCLEHILMVKVNGIFNYK